MKKVLLGLITGLTLGMASTTFAAVGDKVEATFASFLFIVNGQEKMLDADPLVYQGSTYLPVRTVANILGFDVTYKADTRTIEMNGATQPMPSEPPAETPTEEPAPRPGESPAPSPEPTASPEPSPEPTVEPSPSPETDKAAACQAIRDKYESQIVAVGYGGGTEGQKRLKVHNLEYYRDQELAAKGC